MGNRDDAGVHVVVGNPGHGKSFYSVRAIFAAVKRGGYVATNVELVDGWEHKLARTGRGALKVLRMRVLGLVGAKNAAAKIELQLLEIAAAYLRLVYPVRDVQELRDIRLPACRRCRACKRGGACSAEARAVCVLDELSKWLGRRLWNQRDPRNRAVGPDGEEISPVVLRQALNDFFFEHRKRGWRVIAITQSLKLIDNQVGEIYETWTKLKNLRRISKPYNPFYLFRIDLFVAVTYWGADRHATRIRTEWFLLERRLAELYNTMATYALAEDDEANAIYPWGRYEGESTRNEAEEEKERERSERDDDDDDEAAHVGELEAAAAGA